MELNLIPLGIDEILTLDIDIFYIVDSVNQHIETCKFRSGILYYVDFEGDHVWCRTSDLFKSFIEEYLEDCPYRATYILNKE